MLTNKLLERPLIAALIRRYRSQRTFLANRFQPGNVLGLALTAQLALLAASGWIFGTLLQDVLGGDDAIRLDRPVVRYLAGHRTAWLTTAMKDVTRLGSTVVLIPLVTAIAIAARRRTRSWAPLAQLGLSLGGAIALYELLKPLVGRPRPHLGRLVTTATGWAFPSGHATQTAAVAVTLAILASTRVGSWARRVAVWLAAVLVTLVVGFSRVYLGVHWPTDVLAGWALGATWAALVNLGMRWPERTRSVRQTFPASPVNRAGSRNRP